MKAYLTKDIVDEVLTILEAQDSLEQYELTFRSECAKDNFPKIVRRAQLIGAFVFTKEISDDFYLIIIGKHAQLYSSGKITLPEDSSDCFGTFSSGLRDLSKIKKIDFKGVDSSGVKIMRCMFSGCDISELDLSDLDTSNVTDMSCMFCGCHADIINMDHWDTSNVTDMSYMFNWCTAATIDLHHLDTSKVENMSRMFSSCSSKMIGLENLNTSNVTDMSGMFWYCDIKQLDLNHFDTSSVENMASMFASW